MWEDIWVFCDISPMDKKEPKPEAVRGTIYGNRMYSRVWEHVFSGGIYRNVRLVKKDIAIFWYGMFITTLIWQNSGTLSKSKRLKRKYAMRVIRVEFIVGKPDSINGEWGHSRDYGNGGCCGKK